jgi:hypothetical protein
MPEGGVTGKGFVKGDPRINRKGRPKDFDKLRELAKAISHEVATKEGKQIIVNDKIATVAEIILRQWAQSKDPRLQMAFVEFAYGKPPVRTELTGKDGEKIVIKLVDDDNGD